MSQAYDLAVSICTAAVASPGIVHDPASPLALGSPQTGECLIWTYDPVAHTADLHVSSDVLNLTSTLTFHPDGTLLINGQPIASTGNVDDAVGDAEAAAAASIAAATAAQGALAEVNLAQGEIDSKVAEFDASSALVVEQVTSQAARAETAVANAEEIRNSAAASAATATQAVGDAHGWAIEAEHRASSDPNFIFDDGTKSARGYAAEAAASASLNRAARTRNLAAADLPETFTPGKLFTRARCLNTGAGIVNIGPNMWTDAAGEAWATYRLEKAGGSIKFVGAGGTTTTTAPGLITTAPVHKARALAPVASSMTMVATCTPPTGFTGRVVCMCLYTLNSAVAYTLSPSFSGGIAVVERRSPVSPAEADWSPLGVIYEGSITNWPGGDLNFSLVAAPGTNYYLTKPLLVTGGNAALTPIQAFYKGPNSVANGPLTLPNVPAQSLVLGMSFQRKTTSVFSSFSPNVSLVDSGNMLGAGPGTTLDASDYRNGSYGIFQGVAAGTGNFDVVANYNAAVDRIGVLGIAYQPGVGAAAAVVDMTFAGDRDTLTEKGAEAEVWFNPDGRSVFVQIPK